MIWVRNSLETSVDNLSISNKSACQVKVLWLKEEMLLEFPSRMSIPGFSKLLIALCKPKVKAYHAFWSSTIKTSPSSSSMSVVLLWVSLNSRTQTRSRKMQLRMTKSSNLIKFQNNQILMRSFFKAYQTKTNYQSFMWLLRSTITYWRTSKCSSISTLILRNSKFNSRMRRKVRKIKKKLHQSTKNFDSSCSKRHRNYWQFWNSYSEVIQFPVSIFC